MFNMAIRIVVEGDVDEDGGMVYKVDHQYTWNINGP